MKTNKDFKPGDLMHWRPDDADEFYIYISEAAYHDRNLEWGLFYSISDCRFESFCISSFGDAPYDIIRVNE